MALELGEAMVQRVAIERAGEGIERGAAAEGAVGFGQGRGEDDDADQQRRRRRGSLGSCPRRRRDRSPRSRSAAGRRYRRCRSRCRGARNGRPSVTAGIASHMATGLSGPPVKTTPPKISAGDRAQAIAIQTWGRELRSRIVVGDDEARERHGEGNQPPPAEAGAEGQQRHPEDPEGDQAVALEAALHVEQPLAAHLVAHRRQRLHRGRRLARNGASVRERPAIGPGLGFRLGDGPHWG